jgi:hypothetical protein
MYPTRHEKEFSAKEEPIQASKEDYMILLLEELVRLNRTDKGRIERLMAWEVDMLAGESRYIEADFPHDGWVVRFRSAATGVLRVWPGGTPPASGAIEIIDKLTVRLNSTGSALYLYNSGPVSLHVFVYAMSLADLIYMVA